MSRRWVAGLAFAAAVGSAGALFAVSSPGQRFEETVGLGWLFQLRGPLPPPEGVAVVALDERSAIELGLPKTPRDWPRSVHARLVDALADAGVDVIAFDLAFNRPQAADDDAAFAAAIARAGRVILFQTIERQRKPLGDAGDAGDAPALIAETVSEPLPILADAAVGVAPLLLPNVPARVSRFWAFLGQSEDRMSLPALAVLVQALRQDPEWRRLIAHPDPTVAPPGRLEDAARRLRQAIRAGQLPVAALPAPLPGDRHRLALRRLYGGPDAYHLNFYGPPGTIRHIPYARLLAGDAEAGGGDHRLHGHVVFVGYSELAKPPDFTRDAFVTVYAGGDGVYLSGAEIAATAYANLVAGTSIRPLAPGEALALILALGFAFGLAAARLPPVAAVPATLALAAVYTGVAWLAFARAGLWLPLATPLLAQLPLALVAGAGGRLIGAWRRETGLRHARQAADEASAAKSEALRMAGHDIRTPVQAIVGYLEQMEETPLDPTQRQLVERVMSASDLLLDMLNGVLDLAAIEAGKLRIVDEPVEPRRLLASLVDMLAMQAAAKGLCLTLDVDAGLPAVVTSDPLRLRQILANLLSNAIKFTDRGRITVSARRLPGPSPTIAVAVTDTGVGIDAAAAARLFEPYRRIGATAARPGTGLGLSLSRQLARLMGGDITVASRPGVGSTFTLTLPLVLPAALPAAAASVAADLPPDRPLGLAAGLGEGLSAPSPAAPPGPVVIVDDDPDSRTLIGHHVQGLGLDAVAFAEAAGALAFLDAAPSPPVLVISDYHLPGLPGPALIRRLKATPALAAVPVIGMTAEIGAAAADAFRTAGADRVLVKPIGRSRLAEALQALAVLPPPPGADHPRPTAAIEAPAARPVFRAIADILASTEPATSEPAGTDAAGGGRRGDGGAWPAFDPAHVTDALGADHPRLAAILAAYRRQAAEQLSALTAAAALDDAEAIGRTAHRLAGASLSFGVIRLGETCRALEQAARLGDRGAMAEAIEAAQAEFAAAEAAIDAFLAAGADARGQSSASL
jgi:signal transduction histidine kinase/CheY-like chemotaxis protein/HPt (histidine-containing phosphotransfer) domain-containing protein